MIKRVLVAALAGIALCMGSLAGSSPTTSASASEAADQIVLVGRHNAEECMKKGSEYDDEKDICRTGGVNSTSPKINLWNVGGTIVCDKPIVGVWVNAGTQSGWAEWDAIGEDGTMASFSKSFKAGTTASLNVGCGGTPENWEETNKSSGRMLSTHAIDYKVICGRGKCSAVGIAG